MEFWKGRLAALLSVYVGLVLCADQEALAQTHTRVAQPGVPGALTSYNSDGIDVERKRQYRPEKGGFECLNGVNRFTRALYGGHTDYRVETSDRPVFAVVKKGHHRHVRFIVNGVPLDSADYCRALYKDGMRHYVMRDRRWGGHRDDVLRVHVAALPDEEGAVWQFVANNVPLPLNVVCRVCEIKGKKLSRNGDLGVDPPDVFEAAAGEPGLQVHRAETVGHGRYAHVVVKGDRIVTMPDTEAFELFNRSVAHSRKLAERVVFETPDPDINTLGSALVFAADGDWDGKTWLHGCVGWRMPLAGWRAAYAGDVLGWNDRAVSHFNAYAKSQVQGVRATIKHPSQDLKMNMARAEKKWGTQMYSNGYICRNPERNDQMHHYDMNLNYMDELLWHFQYDADKNYMKKMWPTIVSHLAWEKRNFDPDGDHLYDAYCCIWASDALYYSGGAVTHSSAYNYRGNLLAARIAELIGKDPKPYKAEAEAILKAMNERLWMKDKGVWAEYQDAMGLKRLHDHPGVWSIYTPIDCGACTGEQAWQAIGYMNENIPHIPIFEDGISTISTTDWLPYAWSINNVAPAEVFHTALACFEAGRKDEGYELLKANILDNMYYGHSPANFGQLSHLDAARGECYRDFGDCIGIASRALIQGLFGVVPNALYDECIIRPSFPDEWGRASLKTPYIEYKYMRIKGDAQTPPMERFEITQHFKKPLKIVVRQHIGGGRFRDITGTNERHQVIEVDLANVESEAGQQPVCVEKLSPRSLGLEDPSSKKGFKTQNIKSLFNATVTDIFRNKYVAPRPKTTTLQIPTQGVGEWCHPQYTPEIDDKGLRRLAKGGKIKVADVPFQTPEEGRNIIFTSLWKNYPDAVEVPLSGTASSAYLLMAGSTNHMQSHIDNGIVVVSYTDNTSDTLRLRNPDNWCPIEQDYYVDNMAFCTVQPRPYRLCLGTGAVSRNLGDELKLSGVYGREIPGGAAQMLNMPLNNQKSLKSLTLRTLSNDVVIGLMAITLQ